MKVNYRDGTHSANCAAVGRFHSAVLLIVAMPVFVYDRFARVRLCRKTVEVPQSQFLHGCGRRCALQRQVPGIAGRFQNSLMNKVMTS